MSYRRIVELDFTLPTPIITDKFKIEQTPGSYTACMDFFKRKHFYKYLDKYTTTEELQAFIRSISPKID